MVTEVPAEAEPGLIPVMVGLVRTVNATPLLAMLFTVTTTLPVVAPLGTETVMPVSFQLVAVAVVPLNLTVLVP
jgi:hypothetical protein